MAYITTERVAEIRKELKGKFPLFKFSITKQDYSTVHITILEAPVMLTCKPYECINIYRLDSYKGYVKEVVTKIEAIANAGVKYYETGDYGTQPSHYVDIRIGNYDRPFKMVVRNEKGKASYSFKVKK